MNISEKIRYFAENMSFKFALARIGQLIQLKDEIKRYLTKEVEEKSKMPLQFTSADLRALAIQLEKVQKQANKKINFAESKKRLLNSINELLPVFEKETDFEKKRKLRKKAYSDETMLLTQYMALARDLQMLLSIINYFALDASLIEEIHQHNANVEANNKRKAKEEDDKILREELEFILFDLLKEAQ